MQNLDNSLLAGNVALHCFSDCEEDAEQLVIFELVIPIAAKVPAPRQHVEIAKLVVRQASVTSTVPAKIVTQLQVNNTAQSAGWCTTATLAAPQPHGQRAAAY